MANLYIFAFGIILMIIGFINVHNAKAIRSDNKNTVFIIESLYYLFSNRSFVTFVIIYILYQGVIGTQGIYQQLMMKE